MESVNDTSDLDRMVRNQIQSPHDNRPPVVDRTVLSAIRAVPRHLFVPEEYRNLAYQDRPLPIGHGQTISQPYIVAVMTELLQLAPEHTVLEVGTGSGYQAAVLAEIVRQVYTMEIVGSLAAAARERLAALGYDNVEIRTGDGYLGWPEHAPFDAIITTAAPKKIPDALVDQLKAGGRMVIPIGPVWRTQKLVLVDKNADESIARHDMMSVGFVPMIRDKPGY